MVPPEQSRVVVSFRGKKFDIVLESTLSVGDIKFQVADSVDGEIVASDIILLYKGKKLLDDSVVLSSILTRPAKIHRMMATGVSSAEKAKQSLDLKEGLSKHRVRDDLTEHGRQDQARRIRLGQTMMRKANQRQQQQRYGFGKIETLPGLPNEAKAREILTQLASDPGVLACMAKHKWNVGSLAELYPEGKVGESAVCLMGLNKNHGQQILLRIRTDDLKGFRKILSVRKVLFHELAHNVHSEHNQDFFQLMRQIERECNEMDWTQGDGMTLGASLDGAPSTQEYRGGTFRLGGSSGGGSGKGTSVSRRDNVPVRELAARAAIMRLSAEEHEISEACGCANPATFLPSSLLTPEKEGEEAKHQAKQ